MLTIGFIGAGITGNALAVTLAQQGYHVNAVSSRSLSSARKLADRVDNCQVYETSQQVADAAQLVFIATPDDVIAEVASKIEWHEKQHVVHCSGAHSIDIIESARKFGASTGCFHPLQTFASIDQAVQNLPGSTFGIEAEGPLLVLLKQMAGDLEGNNIILKAGDKVLYHAAAVFACNYLVTLTKLATDLWRDFGVTPNEAIKALMPLMEGTLKNIENVGLPDCLTGPIARGDVGTIEKHIEALKHSNPDLLESYMQLGLQTIPVAVAKGKIDSNQAERLKGILKQKQGVYS
ncbi:Rossmann-like and DUF2520 domain-containing protein [Chloroflexota bacterium]